MTGIMSAIALSASTSIAVVREQLVERLHDIPPAGDVLLRHPLRPSKSRLRVRDDRRLPRLLRDVALSPPRVGFAPRNARSQARLLCGTSPNPRPILLPALLPPYWPPSSRILPPPGLQGHRLSHVRHPDRLAQAGHGRGPGSISSSNSRSISSSRRRSMMMRRRGRRRKKEEEGDDLDSS